MVAKDPTGRGGARPSEEQWADFADLVFFISREITFGGYSSEEAISLSPSEGVVMRYLFRHPGAIASKVAEAAGLQRSNLSTVLKSLEKKGVLERRPSAEDAREVHIYPTPLGKSNYALVRKEWARRVWAAVGHTGDIGNTIELLRKVQAGLVQLRQPDGDSRATG
jgi:DNA-binding MarR family transcriptional regulator